MGGQAYSTSKTEQPFWDDEVAVASAQVSPFVLKQDELKILLTETLLVQPYTQTAAGMVAPPALYEGSFSQIAVIGASPIEGEQGNGRGAHGHPAADKPHLTAEQWLESYAITGQLLGHAADQCRDPLLLRFFCEAYRGQDVGAVQQICLKELFDRYWSQRLIAVAERLVLQECKGSVNEWAAQAHDLVLNIAAHMLRHNVRSIPLAELTEAVGPEKLSGQRWAIYEQILKESIILEEHGRRRSRGKRRQVVFVYDAFMEHLMARSLARDWKRAGFDEAAIMTEVESLLGTYQSLTPLVGVLVHLAPMLRASRGLHLWRLLLERGQSWRTAILEAFHRLPKAKLHPGVFNALAEILTTDGENIQEQVLDILRTKHLGPNTPRDLARIVARLTMHPRESVRRRAVLVLGVVAPAALALPVLVRAVGDARHSVRRNAVVALSRLQDAPVLEPLLAALADSNPRVRCEAARALGKHGKAQAVAPLVAALKDADELVRQAAAEALGLLGDRQAVEPLIKTLQDRYQNVRWAAVEALGELGDRRAARPLITTLKHSDSGTRQRTVEALGRLGEPLVRPLVGALKDRNANVRWAAVRALEKAGEPVVKHLTAALEESDAKTRAGAAQTLGRLGDARGVGPLIAALHDGSRPVRQAATEALQSLGESASTALVAALRDNSARVRQHALCALSHIWKWPELIELGSDDWRLQAKACWVLGQIGDRRALEPLVAALRDPNADVRRTAANGLGYLRDARALEPLTAALQDSDARARLGAAEALGFLGHAQAVQPLIDTLNDGDIIVRQTAAEALVRLGEPAVAPLSAALQDKRGVVRRYAVRVLAQMHNLRTVEPFLVALKQTDPIVREEAIRALHRLDTEEARMALRQYEEQMPRSYSMWRPLVGMRKLLAEMHS